MAIVHIVAMTFQPDTTDTVITTLAAALDELALQSGAVAYRHGRDLRIRDGNADYAITAVFEDERAFRAYMASPQHQRLISELVTPHLQGRSTVQFVSGTSR